MRIQANSSPPLVARHDSSGDQSTYAISSRFVIGLVKRSEIKSSAIAIYFATPKETDIEPLFDCARKRPASEIHKLDSLVLDVVVSRSFQVPDKMRLNSKDPRYITKLVQPSLLQLHLLELYAQRLQLRSGIGERNSAFLQCAMQRLYNFPLFVRTNGLICFQLELG